jgi:sodium/hydrogen antiporter
MFFVTFGLLFGSEGTGWITLDVGGEELRGVAELTLTLVLFTDASRLNLRALRHDYPLPARLLGVGLPLTIGLGALAAKALFGGLTWLEVGLVGVILAPTDAALGQAVVRDRRLPVRVSQGLNVESGLNDGICVPLPPILLAASNADEGVIHAAAALRLVLEQIGYGLPLVSLPPRWAQWSWGGPAGAGSSRRAATCGHFGDCCRLLRVGRTARWEWLHCGLHGGLVFPWLNRKEMPALTELVVDAGELSAALTFVLFGAVVVGPLLHRVDAAVAIYAALSLTVVRMLPVTVALLGSHAGLRTVGFIGWFGPRGVASIVFVVIAAGQPALSGAFQIGVIAFATVLASVYLHGLTAAPIASRYAKWYETHPRKADLKESAGAHRHHSRWERNSRG